VTTDLHARVLHALDSKPPGDGVVVWGDGRILAARDPAPGAGAWVIVLDVEPFRFPDPPPKTARRVLEDPRRERQTVERGRPQTAASGAERPE
jgi:hypothetical protein